MPRIKNTPVAKMWAGRKKLKLSQAKLATMLDPPVSQGQVARWENGSEFIPPARVTQIEALLGVKLPKIVLRPEIRDTAP